MRVSEKGVGRVSEIKNLISVTPMGPTKLRVCVCGGGGLL